MHRIEVVLVVHVYVFLSRIERNNDIESNIDSQVNQSHLGCVDIDVIN
jgi:hypothetical protein